MNTDVSAENTRRFERLAKPKARFDKTIDPNAFNVKRGALSYQITDTLNKLAQPKQKSDINSSDLPSKNASSNAGKQIHRRLINSDELSKDVQESKQKKFLLDTYARITAARNKRCSKRLHELAKPKQNRGAMQPEIHGDFDGYVRTIKKYDPKTDFAYFRQKRSDIS